MLLVIQPNKITALRDRNDFIKIVRFEVPYLLESPKDDGEMRPNRLYGAHFYITLTIQTSNSLDILPSIIK
jgi:hypothetical protein